MKTILTLSLLLNAFGYIYITAYKHDVEFAKKMNDAHIAMLQDVVKSTTYPNNRKLSLNK